MTVVSSGGMETAAIAVSVVSVLVVAVVMLMVVAMLIIMNKRKLLCWEKKRETGGIGESCMPMLLPSSESLAKWYVYMCITVIAIMGSQNILVAPILIAVLKLFCQLLAMSCEILSIPLFPTKRLL